jgi:hypothetical protein
LLQEVKKIKKTSSGGKNPQPYQKSDKAEKLKFLRLRQLEIHLESEICKS